MKTPRLLSLLILAASLFGITAASAEKTTPSPAADKTVDNMRDNQKAFLNLPEESRREFVDLYRESSRLFSQKRVLEAIDTALKAQGLFDDSPEIHNVLGSCYVEIRNFDKAIASFKKARELSTDSHSILFNMGEVYFVTKQWEQAITTFEELLLNLPENQTMSLGRLAEFKILLCKLKLGQKEDAHAMANKYDFLDDSPYHYFAQSALAYESGNEIEAEQWLRRATRIFRDPAMISPWQDTFVEYGYIKSFYGGDEVSP